MLVRLKTANVVSTFEFESIVMVPAIALLESSQVSIYVVKFTPP
jgi:hypothetical protein